MTDLTRIDAALASIADAPTYLHLDDVPPGQRPQVQRAAERAGLSVEGYLARAAQETATPEPLSNEDPVGLAVEVRRWR